MGKKNVPIDGIGPYEIAKIRSGLRIIWHRCTARKLAVKRCIGPDGFFVCERCKKQCPKLAIDHIVPVGKFDSGFIWRLFCKSDQLQGLCTECHKNKTKLERKLNKILSE